VFSRNRHVLFSIGTNANWYKPNSFTQYRVKQSKRKRRELVPPPVSMANEFYTNMALQVRISPNSSNVVIFLASNSLGTEFNRIDVRAFLLILERCYGRPLVFHRGLSM